MTDFKGTTEDTDRIRKLVEDRRKAEEKFRELSEKIEKENQIKPKRYVVSSTRDTSTSFIGLLTDEQKKKSKAYQAYEQERKRKAKELEAKKRKAEEMRKKNIKKLSFQNSDEDSEDEPETKQIRKSPDVDTSFLRDRERDGKIKEMRTQIEKEWDEKQKAIKSESITVQFSFYDGSGQRTEMTVPKGCTIGEFLDKARTKFKETRNSTIDQLLFVKEDLIIPHQYTFYDLIESKARGKSGPLFHFDVHDDVRLTADARVEKDESHPAKVVERHWYEHNKHIFPASRWEIFDPNDQFTEYTIHDRIKKH